jgi:hypothetical protein
MKFCPVVPEICRGQVHALQKERIRIRIIIRKIKIIIRNRAKTISHSDRSPLEGQFCVFKIFKMSAIFKMAAKTRHKNEG